MRRAPTSRTSYAAGRLPDTHSRSAGGGTRRPERALSALRVALGLLLFCLVVFAVVRTWHDVGTTAARIAPVDLLLAEALVIAGLVASALTWRVALRELGSTVRVEAAAKIYLVGQLGKYLPGSVWAVAAQMELASRAGVPRLRAAAASVVAIGVNVVTGLAVGLLILTRLGGVTSAIALAGLLVVCAVALSPPVLTRLINLGLRVARRPQLQRAVSWPGIAAASIWSVASSASYGLSVWVLAIAVGAPAGEALPLCLAGTALGMTLGFLVVIAPSGIGVREALIVAALAPVLDRREALAVALVARLLFTVADLVAAAVVVPVRIRASDAT